MTLFEISKLAHRVRVVVLWFLSVREFIVIEKAVEATFPFVDEVKKYKFGAEPRNYNTKQIGASPVPLYGISVSKENNTIENSEKTGLGLRTFKIAGRLTTAVLRLRGTPVLNSEIFHTHERKRKQCVFSLIYGDGKR